MKTEPPKRPRLFAQVLAAAREYDASDIHLIAGLPPAFRVGGEIITALNYDAIQREELFMLAETLLSPAQRLRLEKERELSISHYDQTFGRIRLSLYHRIGVPEMSIRMCNLEIKTADQLMIPKAATELTKLTSGLILVTGPTGMGKTTTLNYMIDSINSSRRCKIVTIEDPVEFEHPHRKSIITQIEVGTDTLTFAHCLRHVLRLDPDVICIGEMRDLDTIETALTAAETGHLVIATLHTPNTSSTVERIVSAFEGSRQPQIIYQLASSLQGVIAQRLVPTIDRSSRVLASEVLIATDAVRNIIRENRAHQIYNVISTSKHDSHMHTMESSLMDLYLGGKISYETALLNASNTDYMKHLLHGQTRKTET